MKFRHLTALFLAASSLVLSSVSAARNDRAPASSNPSDENATSRVKFSDSAKPGTLKLSLPWAEARVIATDGDEVVVTSSLDKKGRNEVDHEGFRRLDEDVTFELVEKNNVATIVISGDNPWISNGAEFDIQVPRNTNLILRTEAGGDINVEGVQGDIDINTMNGEVTLRDITSSAVVNTMNGEIRAYFAQAPQKAVSLSSMNGEIDLRLPADTKANLRMRTHNGGIRTNFPADALQTKTEKNTRPTAPTTPGDHAAEREFQREYEREISRAERDRARAERDAARATADAIRAVNEAVRTTVAVSVNGDVAVAPMPPMPPTAPTIAMPNFGGKSIVGTLNGGGIDIKLTSMNGTITLRESK